MTTDDPWKNVLRIAQARNVEERSILVSVLQIDARLAKGEKKVLLWLSHPRPLRVLVAPNHPKLFVTVMPAANVDKWLQRDKQGVPKAWAYGSNCGVLLDREVGHGEDAAICLQSLSHDQEASALVSVSLYERRSPYGEFPLAAIPKFETEDQAFAWMACQVGYDHPGVPRIMYMLARDPLAEQKYLLAREESGGPAEFDELVYIDGKLAVIGCGYGD